MGLFLSSLLYTRDTLAIFQSEGKMPELIDLLKITHRESDITGAASLASVQEILSSPVALFVERLVSSLRTVLDFIECNLKRTIGGFNIAVECFISIRKVSS